MSSVSRSLTHIPEHCPLSVLLRRSAETWTGFFWELLRRYGSWCDLIFGNGGVAWRRSVVKSFWLLRKRGIPSCLELAVTDILLVHVTLFFDPWLRLWGLLRGVIHTFDGECCYC